MIQQKGPEQAVMRTLSGGCFVNLIYLVFGLIFEQNDFKMSTWSLEMTGDGHFSHFSDILLKTND